MASKWVGEPRQEVYPKHCSRVFTGKFVNSNSTKTIELNLMGLPPFPITSYDIMISFGYNGLFQ